MTDELCVFSCVVVVVVLNFIGKRERECLYGIVCKI